MTSKVKKGLIIGAAAIVVIAAINSFGSKSGSSTSGSKSAVAEAIEEVIEEPKVDADGIPYIDATELYDAYQNNEIAATKEYKGKKLNIKGTILDFDQDLISKNPIIRLDGNGIWGINCEFTKDTADEIASLSKGQSITIKCTIGDFQVGCYLEANNCKIVKK